MSVTDFMEACGREGTAYRFAFEPENRRRQPAQHRRRSDEGDGDTGGIICITTWTPLIWNGKPGMPVLDDYIRCLDYAVNSAWIMLVPRRLDGYDGRLSAS
jgi:hypothetical protein